MPVGVAKSAEIAVVKKIGGRDRIFGPMRSFDASASPHLLRMTG
jgi:hypothetical protein